MLQSTYIEVAPSSVYQNGIHLNGVTLQARNEFLSHIQGPICDDDVMFRQVVIVQIHIQIGWMTHHQQSKVPIRFLVAGMGMVKLSSVLAGIEHIAEGVPRGNRTLRHHRNAIHPGSLRLVHPVPVDGSGRSLHVVQEIYYDYVVTTNDDGWARHLAIQRHYRTFHTVGGDALWVGTIGVVPPSTVLACSEREFSLGVVH